MSADTHARAADVAIVILAAVAAFLYMTGAFNG